MKLLRACAAGIIAFLEEIYPEQPPCCTAGECVLLAAEAEIEDLEPAPIPPGAYPVTDDQAMAAVLSIIRNNPDGAS